MSRLGDVRIALSRGNREYQAASSVDGHARISPPAGIRSANLQFKCIHRITYADSTTEDVSCSLSYKNDVALRPGTPMDIPFSLKTPGVPLTYAGNLFSVSYLVSVTVDYGDRWDPGYDEGEFVLLPADHDLHYTSSPNDSLQVELPALQGTANQKMVVKVAAMLVAAIFLGSCFGWMLFFLPLALISKKVRNLFQIKNTGTLQILLGKSSVTAGGHLPVRAVFHSARPVENASIHITLKGVERVGYSSPVGEIEDDRAIFEKRYVMIRDESIPMARRTIFNTRVPVPETTSFSMNSGGASISWVATMVVSVPGYDDWLETFAVRIVPPVDYTKKPPPVPKRPQAVLDMPLQQTMAELRDPVDPPAPESTPEPAPQPVSAQPEPDPDTEKQALLNVLGERIKKKPVEPTADPVSPASRADQSSHLTRPDRVETRPVTERLFASERSEAKRLFEHEEPASKPVPEITAEDVQWPESAGTSLPEIVEDVLGAGRYSSDQKAAIEKYRGYECNVQATVRRTSPSFGISSGDEYRKGMTVVAVLDGRDIELSICFPESRNDEIRAIAIDSPLSVRVRFRDYNSIRRQVMCEAV